MTATRIDPNYLYPTNEQGAAADLPTFYSEVIAAINEHADAIDLGGSANDLLITDYGAVGDGVTDDSAAFTAATAAAATLQRRLFLTEGTYLLDSAVSIDAPNGFRMAGTGATIRFASLSRNAFEVANSSTKISIENVSFQGDNNNDKNTNLGVAIYVGDAAADVDVIGCTFEHCRPVQATSNDVVGRFYFARNRVLNSPLPVSTSQYSIIVGNWFLCDSIVTTRAQAVYLYGGISGCIIAHNVFRNIAEEDIQIRASSARYQQKFGFVITGNYFENSFQYSIWVGSDSSINAGGYAIVGNTFRNCSAPIMAQGLSASTIASNTIFTDWECWDYNLNTARGGGIYHVGGGTYSSRWGIAQGVMITGNTIAYRHPVFATIKLTSLPQAGDSITIGSITYTWRASASVAGEVTIGSSIVDSLGNLQRALQSDAVNDYNTVLRTPADVFYNQYAANGAVTDTLVVVSKATFTLSSASPRVTLFGPVNTTGAGLDIETSLCPVITNNNLVNCSEIAIQRCYSPTFQGNVIRGGTSVQGTGNALSVYKYNRWPDLDPSAVGTFRRFRQLMIKDAFPVVAGNDVTTQQEYATKELLGAHGIVNVGDGKSRGYLWFGVDDYGDGDANTIPFSWRDGYMVQLRGAGLTSVDLTFKRSSPGAAEFNSAADLIAKIISNGGGDWTAAFAAFTDVGGTSNPQLMIEIKRTAAGAPSDPVNDPPRIYCTTLAKTCGVILREDGVTYSRMLGGAAAATKTAIFSPIANDQIPALVQGMDATSVALAPVCYLADAKGGVGYEITHTAAAGTESFVFSIPQQ